MNLNGWIARDEDGDLYFFYSHPDFEEGTFLPNGSVSSLLPDSLFPDLLPGYKQPVALAITPTGEPVRGEQERTEGWPTKN